MEAKMHTDSEGKRLVDLEATFARRLKVTHEADDVTWFSWAEIDRPWLLEIVGHNGTVSPWGGELLQCSSDRPRISARLLALPFVVAHRGGAEKGEECVIRFHVDHAAAVFEIIRPYLRRQVSETEKARLREMGASHRFKKGVPHGVQGHETDPNSDER